MLSLALLTVVTASPDLLLPSEWQAVRHTDKTSVYLAATSLDALEKLYREHFGEALKPRGPTCAAVELSRAVRHGKDVLRIRSRLVNTWWRSLEATQVDGGVEVTVTRKPDAQPPPADIPRPSIVIPVERPGDRAWVDQLEPKAR